MGQKFSPGLLSIPAHTTAHDHLFFSGMQLENVLLIHDISTTVMSPSLSPSLYILCFLETWRTEFSDNFVFIFHKLINIG